MERIHSAGSARARGQDVRLTPRAPSVLPPVAKHVAQQWPAVVTFVALALIWEVVVRWTRTPAYLVPTPSAIVLRLVGDLPFFWNEALVTMEESLGGLLLASAGALVTAAIMAHVPWFERAFFPLAVAVKVTPMVAVAPLLVIWLGFGPLPKILVAALLTYFPLLSNALIGFRSVNPRALEFLRSLDASAWEIFLALRWPQALPYLFSAYKVTTTLSIVGAVVAEWIGADSGLGHVILLANSNLDMTTLAAAVLVLALIGVGLYVLVDTLEYRLLFWHESALTTEVAR